MEVEVVKMEVCFLENGNLICENGSLFFRKMEVEVKKMEVYFKKNGSLCYKKCKLKL